RLDHDGRPVPQREEGSGQEADRRRDQERAHGAEMPLRHSHEHPARGETRRQRDDRLREAAMTKMDKTSAFSGHTFSRRDLLKAGGAFVVSIGMPTGLDTVLAINSALAQGAAARPPLTPDQLSSFIAVNADGTVSAYFGKMDMGQGVFVAIGQIVA